MWSQQPDGEGHHLSIVSPQPGLGGDSVVGVSDDGTQVYFLSNFSLLHSDEGTISEVGAFVDFADVAPNLLESRFGLDTFFLAPARVSPDGRHLLFMVSTASGFVGHGGLIDYDPGTCSPDGIPKPCRELYVYSAEDETLRCASCNPSGEAATATAMVGVKEGIAVLAPHASRAISDDGRYVFFSTAERLVAEDVNGVEDAYEYDTLSEEPHLLSSGEDPRPSYFMDASPDGRDVFFLTSEQLSAWDSDDSVDLYDARRGGGIAEPVPPPPACQGDACQPPPVILNDLSPGSQTFAGAGNQSARRCRARTGRVAKQAGKKQRRGTKRCRRVKRGAVR
jgi:hypothetical protein